MEDVDSLREIYIHTRASENIRQFGFDEQSVAATLAATWRTRITSGSKIKRLRDVPGNDCRLRLGKLRGVFSVRGGAAFLHLFEPRDKIYDQDSLDTALRRYYEMQENDVSLRDIGYERFPFPNLQEADAQIDTARSASISYLLRPSQQIFFNKVLPLEGALSKTNPRLVIGYGPPGSGKTVVGIDLAVESTLDGHRVDILVPSRSLKNEYRRLIHTAGGPLIAQHDENPGIRVLRFDEYFAHRAGLEPAFDREARVLSWAHSSLSNPKFQAQLGKLGRGLDRQRIMEELPTLIDVLLEDHEWWRTFTTWRTRSKDPLVASVEPYLLLLNQLRGGFLEWLSNTEVDRIKTRAALAGAQAMTVDLHAPPRLIIVDEAQDLAPAEWRAILEDSFITHDREDRRVVLLGEMQQRVSRVPFSWDDIKNFARSPCCLSEEQIDALDVDNVSYRMTRSIGRAAKTVFDKRIHEEGSFRQTSELDLDRLPDGGGIDVAVVSGGQDRLSAILDSEKSQGTGYLFVVHGRGVEGPHSSIPDVISYSIKEAKGLEADRVIVNLPFGKRLEKTETGRIGHDNATEFYTALSRARQKIFLIIDEPAWQLLSQASEAWKDANIKSGSEVTEHWLRNAVNAMRISLSAEQVTRARLEQLRAIATSSSDKVAEEAEKALAAIRDIARFSENDTVYPLLEIGATIASRNARLYSTLRERYFLSGAEMATAEKIVVLCLLGELTIAAELASQHSPGNFSSWDPVWLTLIRDESPLQRVRLAQSGDFSPSDWTDDALEKSIVRKSIGLLSSQMPDARLRSYFSMLESRMAAPSQDVPELAADSLGWRRVIETLEKIRSRMEEMETRAKARAVDRAQKEFTELSQKMGQLRDRISEIRAGK